MVHSDLKLEDLALPDESAVIEASWHLIGWLKITCAWDLSQATAVGLLLSCGKIQLVTFVKTLVIVERDKSGVEQLL